LPIRTNEVISDKNQQQKRKTPRGGGGKKKRKLDASERTFDSFCFRFRKILNEDTYGREGRKVGRNGGRWETAE
jgi:hypothetical protein